MFAGDTSLFKEIIINMHYAASVVNKDLETMHDWCKQWRVIVNPTKTVYMLFFPVKSHDHKYLQYFMVISDCNRYLNTSTLASFLHQICLGQNIYLQSLLKAINILVFSKENKYILSRKSLEICYFSFIRPIVEYGDVIYDSCSKADSGKLENVQLEAAQIATGCKNHTSHKQLYIELGWMKLSDHRENKKLKKPYCITRFNTRQYLIDTLEEMKIYLSHSTRAAATHTIYYQKVLFSINYYILEFT